MSAFMKLTVLVAALAAASLAAVALAQAAMGLPRLECAAGYRLGPHGNCQPDSASVSSICQPGFHYQVWPSGDGYRCELDYYTGAY